MNKVHNQDIKELQVNLEEAAVQSEISAEHALVEARHYRPKFDAVWRDGAKDRTEAEVSYCLRIKDWVFNSESDAKRWTTEAVTFRMAAALLDQVTTERNIFDQQPAGWTMNGLGNDDNHLWHCVLQKGYQTSYTKVVGSSKCATPEEAMLVAFAKARAFDLTPEANTER